MQAAPPPAASFPEAWVHTWTWKSQAISFASPGLKTGKDVVLLIHGFGACKEHWRFNLGVLNERFEAIAIDLIGFGMSAKPNSRLADEPDSEGSLLYCIDTWASQICDFIAATIDAPVHLVGNSIGGVVALAAARRLEQSGHPARSVVLIDCAQRAIDDKRVAEQPLTRRFGRPLLKTLMKQRWLTTALFRSLARPGVIRAVLRQAYPSGAHVDDALVLRLQAGADASGATESFRGFINLFNDRLAPELLAELSTPVRLIWGQADPWEPVAEARRWSQLNCVKELVELESVGHCPHDEAPELVNPLLLKMLTAAADGSESAVNGGGSAS